MVTLQPSITALVVSCGLTPPVDAARFCCCASEEVAPSNAAAPTIDKMTVFIIIVFSRLIEFPAGLFTKLLAYLAFNRQAPIRWQLKNRPALMKTEPVRAQTSFSTATQDNERQLLSATTGYIDDHPSLLAEFAEVS
jgi:hypothetical protein